MRSTMKKRLVIILLAFGVCAASYSAARFKLIDRLGNRPVLEVNRFIDLGHHETETNAEAVFWVFNQGRAPLQVDRIETKCGCQGLYLVSGDEHPEKTTA